MKKFAAAVVLVVLGWLATCYLPVSGQPSVPTFLKWLRMSERSADPPAPGDGQMVMWMGDGTDRGWDGQMLLGTQSGSSDTRYVDLMAEYVRLQAMFEAQQIRQNAGVPAGTVVGCESGLTIGLSDAGALADVDRYNISAKADCQVGGAHPADSGTGTQVDPFVYADRRWDNSDSTTTAFNWNDFDANYHVKLVNCKIYDYTSQNVYVNIDPVNSSLVLENCELYSTVAGGASAAYAIRIYKGLVRADKTLFSGSDEHAVLFNGGGPPRTLDNWFYATNCRWNDSQQACAENTLNCIHDLSGGNHVWLKNCEFDSPTRRAVMAFINDTRSFTMLNCECLAACDHVIRCLPTMSQALDPPKNILLRNCSLGNQTSQPIYMTFVDGFELDHCTVNDTADADISIYLTYEGSQETKYCRNVNIHHCKIIKPDYDHECIYIWAGREVEVSYCWTVKGEDAYELINPREDTVYHHLVADDAGIACVDCYGSKEAEAGFDFANTRAVIHDIHGDCGNAGGEDGSPSVDVVNCQNIQVYNIFADNTASTVSLPGVRIHWTGDPHGGTSTDGDYNFVSGWLPLSRACKSGAPYALSGTSEAEHNTAAYWHDGQLVIEGDTVDTSNMELR